MTNYFEIKRMSNSKMSYFKQSPMHYLFAMENPDKESAAMTFGSAYHAAVLEPEIFENDYVA